MRNRNAKELGRHMFNTSMHLHLIRNWVHFRLQILVGQPPNLYWSNGKVKFPFQSVVLFCFLQNWLNASLGCILNDFTTQSVSGSERLNCIGNQETHFFHSEYLHPNNNKLHLSHDLTSEGENN